jgi:hypothetical protein
VNAPARRVHRSKTCRTCGVPKLLRHFYHHPTCADGRQNECKECKRGYERDMYNLKRAVRIVRKRKYARSQRGREVRARYLANGGRDLYNENRRFNRRIRALEHQQVAA